MPNKVHHTTNRVRVGERGREERRLSIGKERKGGRERGKQSKTHTKGCIEPPAPPEMEKVLKQPVIFFSSTLSAIFCVLV